MWTALSQAPSRCQRSRLPPRGDPSWPLIGFLELCRTLWYKASSPPFLSLWLWGFVLIQFASFWELCRGPESPFIIILNFVIYPQKPLDMSSCRLTCIVSAMSCINIFKNWSGFAVHGSQQVRMKGSALWSQQIYFFGFPVPTWKQARVWWGCIPWPRVYFFLCLTPQKE